jgi:hypothetical protein
MKRLTMILAVITTAAPVVADPGPRLLKVKPGAYPMVSRKAADVYSVIGEGDVRTGGCTVSAARMAVTIERADRSWMKFYDRDGELEATCELDDGKRHRRIKVKEPQRLIKRQLAVTE